MTFREYRSRKTSAPFDEPLNLAAMKPPTERNVYNICTTIIWIVLILACTYGATHGCK